MPELSREESSGARLRALVTERHKTFVEEMWALFQRTVEQLEEEVRTLRAENERHMRSLQEIKKRKVPRKRAKRSTQEKPDPRAEVEVQTENSSDSENERKQSVQAKEDGEASNPPSEPEVQTENSSDSEGEPEPSKKVQEEKAEEEKGEGEKEEEINEPQSDAVEPDPEPVMVSSDPPTEHSSESSESESEERPKTSRNNKFTLRIQLGKKKQTFECSVCKKSFKYRSVLKMHMLSHATTRSFECSECGSLFAMKYRLDRHMEIHKWKRPSGSSEDFTAETELLNENTATEVRAKARRQELLDKRPQCLQCGKTFSNTGNMRKHIRNMHTKKPSLTRQLQMQVGWRHQHLVCSVCKTRFRFRSELTRHMKSHVEKKGKNYQCNFCLKSFRDKGYLQEHVRLHTGEKPYRCSVCDKCFTFKKSHMAHMKLHEESST